jgi:flagellar protein FliT
MSTEKSPLLMDYYRAIEDSSSKMLDAAKAEDWEQVVRFEGACAVLIEQLRYRAAEEELQPEERKEKARIMQRILRNDAEIRYLTEPRLTQIEHMINGAQRVLH